jgi:hypothetical protein
MTDKDTDVTGYAEARRLTNSYRIGFFVRRLHHSGTFVTLTSLVTGRKRPHPQIWGRPKKALFHHHQ